MKQKRGQITLFIIVGIVVLFSVFAVLYVNRLTQAPKPVEVPVENVPAEIEPIRRFVQNCVDSTAELGWLTIGMQGGIIEETGTRFTEDPFSLLVSNARGTYLLPTLDDVKKQFDLFMKEGLSTCTGNFLDFYELGYRVKQGTITTQVTFGEKEVVTNVDFPITISKGDTNVTISRFTTKTPIRFKRVYDVAQNISNEATGISGNVNLGYLNLPDLNITAVMSDRETIYTIEDHQSLLSGEPYTFIFVTDFRGVK